MDRTSRRVAWSSAVIHGLVHACVLLLPAILADVKRTFGVSLIDVLAAGNLMYFAFGAAALPAGVLADRVGSRTMLVLAAGGCAVSSALVALAPSFTWFWAGLLLLGISAGLYHPSGLSLLSRGVASGERGRAIGIHGVGGNFGEVAAPALAAFFASRFGWRWGFATVGAAAVGSMLLAASLPQPTASAGNGSTAGHRRLAPALAAMWRSVPLRWLLLSAVAGGIVYRGVLTFLPLHLGQAVADERIGAYLTSFVLVVGMAAQRMGGELADRLPRERLLLAEVAVFSPVLVLLAVTQGVGLVALAVTFGFLWYLAQPLSSALAAAYTEAGDHGLLYGVQFALSFGLGSFATTLGGHLLDRGGTSLAFLGFGAAGAVQLLAAAALVRAVRPRTAMPPGRPIELAK